MEEVLNKITPLLRELLTLSPKAETALSLYLNESIKNGARPQDILTLEFQYLREQILIRLLRLLKVNQEQYERAILYLHFGLRLDAGTLEEILELSHSEFVPQLFHAIEKLGLDPQLFSHRGPLISSSAIDCKIDCKTVELETQILAKLKIKPATSVEVANLKNFLQEKYF
ncbi:MAG: hypothetical protein AABY86_06225 [Bdellovibrionota bacterium]